MAPVTWWAWLLLWIALVAGAGFVLFLLARRCWRSLRRLGHEASDLANRVDDATRGVGSWSGPSDVGARIDER